MTHEYDGRTDSVIDKIIQIVKLLLDYTKTKHFKTNNELRCRRKEFHIPLS